MHQSAMFYGRRFFETYCSRDTEGKTVIDVGSQNVNGSLRDVCPTTLSYIGLDFSVGNGVDIVLDDPYKLPFDDNSIDYIVCSSCFEHSEFFWLLFLECIRILKPEGLMYLNVPSNGGMVHRYPVDSWRFFPDSGHALANWANHNGFRTVLLESFVGGRSVDGVYEGIWNDFIGVFAKDEKCISQYPHRMLDNLTEISNGYSSELLQEINTNPLGPDFAQIQELNELVQIQQNQISHLRQLVAEHEANITSILNSSSWQVTRPLRWIKKMIPL